MLKIILLFLLFFTLQPIAAQSHDYDTGIVCVEESGTTTRHEYVASIIQTRMYYTIYTPPCYTSTTEDYPVIYLLHGSNEDDNHWLRLGLAEHLDREIASGRLPPVIVVMPFGNWIANENRFDEGGWGAIFVNQMVPLVESEYRVDASRTTRAIGGISRGGFWAFHIALKHPALFGAVGGHSAFFDEYHASEDNNPLDLVLTAPGVDSMRIWLDRGADDFAAPGLDIMVNRLSERGVAYRYTLHPQGQHNNDYWRSHIATYIDFYTQPWQGDSALDLTTAETVDEDEIETDAALENDDVDTGAYLLLPIVAFPSLQSDITSDRLNTIRGGFLDERLVLTESTAVKLGELGVPVAEGTRIVPDDALFNTLWRDTTLFSLLPFDQMTPRYRVLSVNGINPMDDLETYPFLLQAAEGNYDSGRMTRFLLSGVTAITRGMLPVLDANGVEWATEAIKDYTTRADFFHTSNEVSIYPTCPETTGGRLGGSLSFCSKQDHFQILRLLGLDIVELSGNHNNDYGYDAYRQTLEWYRDNDILTVGGGETLDDAREPLLLRHNGNAIALLSCNWVGPYYALVNEDVNALGGVRPGAAPCDRGWLSEEIPALKASNDIVIVTVQYLELESYQPSAQQRSDFRFLADLGADVVVGTQAHFPQAVEFYPTRDGEAFIHYGLGNFYFDQQFFAGVRFFLDQLVIYEGRLLYIDLFTGLIEDQGRPRPMTPDERLNFLFLILVENGSY